MANTEVVSNRFQDVTLDRGGAKDALGGVAMRRVRMLAEKVAPTSISVLILGECGVGKDVLAQTIHKRSVRAGKPFAAINCAGIPESLVASELFGYERGAFTGAASNGKLGLLEAANGGTVFLDEIGEMPLPMQATLLRVLETREVRPVMSLRSRPVDVRFIAATNKDLNAAVGRGEFRRDLLYRLNAMTLSVPPLRERVDEIPDLAQRFVEATWAEAKRAGAPQLSPALIRWLLRQPWPGNIRELKNLMECATALSDDPEIGLEDLPICDCQNETAPSVCIAGATMTPRPLEPEPCADRQRILDALAACSGNQTRAAALLEMPRRTFVSKLDRYGIPRPQKDFRTQSRKVALDASAAANDHGSIRVGDEERTSPRGLRAPKRGRSLFVVPPAMRAHPVQSAISGS
jgi:two-component system, NtrC family, response regulator AtoC